ncbi:HlyD family secretion protein [Bradyrhizobium sp. CB1015]|uniref:HlyD family secretion protein n=1 Tax=Bradyrhizobium sp. CB1015 TaxID=2976822 RepID=UPI0021AA4C91|nr:HlyD family secretion protein [Bradyrhizobium sp. CB1015]UWU94191.1 HlyD family secretion protein [Bradyrhizobium sp. CB1015]
MNAVTKISEAARAATPAEASAAENELPAAESGPAQARVQSAPKGSDPGTPSRGLRPLIIPLAAVGAAAALVLMTSARWDAWVGASAVQTTDNATVHAEMSRLSARVSGNIRQVLVRDFQRVRAGELLMEIEPADYNAVVAQAEASVAAAQATLDKLESQKAHQRAVIAQAEAQGRSALARELETRQELERQEQLLRGGVAGTKQRLEQATAAHDTASAAVAATEATIEAQRSELEVLNGEEHLLRAKLRASEADLTTAQLRLGYTRIVAPFDGVVGERMVQEGNYVNVGSNLIAVVPLPNVYVVANYKETQLTRVAPGYPVDVTVDMFPGVRLRGRVERISPASGSTFALLPPDNATGNFTKVVQRIPVRISFDPGQPMVDRLRPGMSVVTRIRVDRGA